jgi:putative acetyltransferase
MIVQPWSADDPTLRAMVAEQRAELAAAEGEGHVDFPLHEGIEYVVGVLDGELVACGALQPLEPSVGEVKRMYVRPPYRGRGLSRAILSALEEKAVAGGIHILRLETGSFLAPAVRLYTSSGYQQIANFGQYVGHATSVCFEKALPVYDAAVRPVDGEIDGGGFSASISRHDTEGDPARQPRRHP